MQSERSERHAQALAALLEAGGTRIAPARAPRTSRSISSSTAPSAGFAASQRPTARSGCGSPTKARRSSPRRRRSDTRFEHVHMERSGDRAAPTASAPSRALQLRRRHPGRPRRAHHAHVVRGEDHLSNTPKQLLVLQAARALGLGPQDAATPLYAHLPLLHGPDGKKLSKRHGAASVQELRSDGYLPAAVRNYLALLGWGAGDDQTVLATEDLIERFTLDRVSPQTLARFDETKLRWLNGVWIRELPVGELTARIGDFLRESAHTDVAEDRRLPRAVKIHGQEKRSISLADFFGRSPDRCSMLRCDDPQGAGARAPRRGGAGDVRARCAPSWRSSRSFRAGRCGSRAGRSHRASEGVKLHAGAGLPAFARGDRRDDRLARHLRERRPARA